MTLATRRGTWGIRGPSESMFAVLVRIVLIAAFDVGAIWFVQNAFKNGFAQLAIVLIVIAVMLNLIFLLQKAYPFRWMAIGLSFLILFTIYPMLFTIYVAFTNYGDGHLLTKEQALPVIAQVRYLPEEGKSFSWTAYRSDDGRYALWLIDPSGATFLAIQDESVTPAQPGDPGIGEADAKGIPQTIEATPA